MVTRDIEIGYADLYVACRQGRASVLRTEGGER